PWWLELSSGVWFFTENPHFFGQVEREQDPITTVEGHVSYTFAPRLWLSADATYFAGGRSTLNGIHNDGRQESTRIRLTMSLPVADGLSLKLAWSETVNTRLSGSGFTAYLASIQFRWFDP